MKSYIKTFLVSLAILVGFTSYSNPLDEFVDKEARITTEKEALTDWVQNNSHNKISYEKAKQIVEYSYYYAAQYAVDPLLVLSVAKVESGYRTTVKSKGGAKGIMQVIPYWHKEKLNKRDPFKMGVSIEVGAHILREYLDKGKDNVKKALNFYSGGGGKGYYSKVSKVHAQLSKHIVTYAFTNEKPIYAYHSLDKPIINEPMQVVMTAIGY